MTFGDVILQYRNDHHISQRKFALKSGLSNAYIAMLEMNFNPSTGKPIAPNMNTLKMLAKAMEMDVNTLINMVDPDSPITINSSEIPTPYLPKSVIPITQMQSHSVPLIGSVAAGTPILAEENYDAYIDCPCKADYALRISGDSMNPNYLDGDVVFIRTQDTIDYDGQVLVVLLDDSATLKHVYRQNNGLLLISDNPSYQPMFMPFDEYNTVRVLGKPVGFTRMFKE